MPFLAGAGTCSLPRPPAGSVSPRALPEPTAAPTRLGQPGPFLLLRLRAAVAVVNVELRRSATFQDDPDLTAPYEQAVTQIAAALGETESAHLIELIRKERES